MEESGMFVCEEEGMRDERIREKEFRGWWNDMHYSLFLAYVLMNNFCCVSMGHTVLPRHKLAHTLQTRMSIYCLQCCLVRFITLNNFLVYIFINWSDSLKLKEVKRTKPFLTDSERTLWESNHICLWTEVNWLRCAMVKSYLWHKKSKLWNTMRYAKKNLRYDNHNEKSQKINLFS